MLGGVIFTGVGIGAVLSASLVPLLIEHGLPAAWIGLGLTSAAVAGLGWAGWPPTGRLETIAGPTPRAARMPRGLPSLLLVYGLNALGLVPHMMFLVDFVARGLGRSRLA